MNREAKGRLWIAKITQNNLQELCGCVVIAATSLGEDETWCPWRSTELVLEQHFGHLRQQFSSSQFRCRDFAHASAKRAWQTLTRQKHEGWSLSPELPKNKQRAVSDEEYITCAERALTAALRLMAVCTQPHGLITTSHPGVKT